MSADHPRKSLGQHWLFDEDSLNAMLEAGEISSSDTVLEVGPGLGTLTSKLCEKAKQVIAVELDDELAATLSENVFGPSFPRRRESSTNDITVGDAKFNWIPDPPVFSRERTGHVGSDKAENLEVVHQSILDFDTSKLPKGFKVIANIPYYLTSNLIRKMLENDNPPSNMALLIQKEVAQRIVAKPGQMSIIAVATQFYAEVELKQLVPAELFTPPPKVDSQIIQIKRRTKPLFPDVDSNKFFKIVRAGFSEKRKKLRSSLAGGLHISKTEADEILKKADISLSARAQELTLDQWYELTKSATI